jgi:hypothetical protein
MTKPTFLNKKEMSKTKSGMAGIRYLGKNGIKVLMIKNTKLSPAI